MLSRYHLDANWRLSLLNHFLSFSKDDVVLDAGCGDGFISSEVSGKVRRVVGVDVDREIVEFNKKSVKRENLDFVCANIARAEDAGRLSRGEGFTKIICLDALEHAGEIEGVFRNFAKLLAPGGEIFLTVPLGSGHGVRVEVETLEKALKEKMFKEIEIKKIKHPPITGFLKRFLERFQRFYGYEPRDVDKFSETLSFELDVKNPPILRLYKLFFMTVIRPLTLLEGRPFREGERHLVVMARK